VALRASTLTPPFVCIALRKITFAAHSKCVTCSKAHRSDAHSMAAAFTAGIEAGGSIP
jgi:hypothetical protein